MSRRRSTSIPGLRPAWAAWFALLAVASLARAEGPKPAATVLHLVDGGYVEGELRDSEKTGVLRWQTPSFVEPFAFDVKAVNRIQWPPPEKIERPAGDYCFELAAGDVLFGTLAALDDRRAELIVPRLGRIKIDRANLLRIYRWRDGADLIYLGPNGLVGWHEPAGQSHWREESGQPTTDHEGSSIRGDFGLPTRAVIEFELSWKSKPDFVLALGVDDRDASVKRAFRFEAWGGDLVVQRELEQEADLSVVQEVKNGPGRAHLQAYLDQEKGRILVFSPSGTQLADLQVGSGKAPAMSGLYLANIRGDVRLEWLRIGRWNGEIPREVRVDQARIHRADGSITYGTLTGYRPEPKAFVVKTEKGEQMIAAADVSSVFLSPLRPEPSRMIRAVYLDGSRLSGELERIDSGTLVMRVPGIEGTTRLPIRALRSLVGIARGAKEPTGDPLPRLETGGVRLIGQHENGEESPTSSCLVWHPTGSSTASHLKRGVSGRIFYRESPAPTTSSATKPTGMPMGVVIRQVNPGQPPIAKRFADALANSTSTTRQGPQSLYLRSGDVVTAIITRIDEKGVHFKSSMTTTTFVPHEKVKAVELASLTSLVVRLGISKTDRLLTLPRMQKASPPTHLIRSRNGDYLRARLVGMDEKVVRIETRLEEKDLPRDRISEIIWLHPEELKPDSKSSTDNGPTLVQAVRRDGIRITFHATRFADGILFGTSDVLGDTHIRISEIDQLPIGESIREAAAQLKYGRWTLHNAPEPIEPENTGPDGGSGASGIESALVGKPAPDFDLALLDGKRFRLSGSKGKVVVLDFWATWCGPCIRTMPDVEKVAAEFDPKAVQLVAVNLQESPDQIRKMITRYQLKAPRVALDQDGSIAEKYQAHAIPQTVVIDRDGNVARLFIGGGPHLAEQLREAIKAASK